MTFINRFVPILPVLGTVYCGFAQAPQKLDEAPLKHYTTARIIEEVSVIDDLLNEACWDAVPWGGRFHPAIP